MQARETSARFSKKENHTTKNDTYSGALQDEKPASVCQKLRSNREKKTRTLVVNGVPKSEDGQHGDNDRRRRGVLAVEEATLDAARGRLGRGALWELGVERDEGAQVGALPRRLCSQRKYWSGKW